MDAREITQICNSPVAGSELLAGAQPAAPLLLYLIVVRGGIPGTMLRLGQKSSSLGRSAENTFQVHDNTVSRRHAVISIDAAGAAWVMDLGTTNGTFVNGRRIAMQTPVAIGDGSRIQLGSATLLKYLKLDTCEEGFQRELYERSVRDNLTGLYNRGYFLSQIGPLAELNSLCELGLALILVDIDHFKRVNDTHGHSVGDLILREVAEVLRESTRGEDLVARYGGEEFILALPSCSLEQATERAEHIRTRLSSRLVDASQGPVGVTASLGLSFAPAGRVRDVVALITAADQALYEAKRSGRNRVIASTIAHQKSGSETESADAFVLFEQTPGR
jgi:two-component system, cell cycle response regulator